MLILQSGNVIGCERNGHSTVYCNDCEIDNVDCPAYKKMPEKPTYETVSEEVAKLVESKQRQYGDSFGNSYKILEVLYPNGIQLKDYQDLLTVVRVIDKLFRITRGDQGEESGWKDINGYSLLSLVRNAGNDK